MQVRHAAQFLRRLRHFRLRCPNHRLAGRQGGGKFIALRRQTFGREFRDHVALFYPVADGNVHLRHRAVDSGGDVAGTPGDEPADHRIGLRQGLADHGIDAHRARRASALFRRSGFCRRFRGRLRRPGRRRRGLFRTFLAGEKPADFRAVERAGPVTVHLVEIRFERPARFVAVDDAILVGIAGLCAAGQFGALRGGKRHRHQAGNRYPREKKNRPQRRPQKPYRHT